MSQLPGKKIAGNLSMTVEGTIVSVHWDAADTSQANKGKGKWPRVATSGGFKEALADLDNDTSCEFNLNVIRKTI